MSYAQIDPMLNRWAESRGFHIMTVYQDYEVRSMDVVTPQGARFQLWLDPPEKSGKIRVHVWDYRKRSADYEVKIQNLPGCLDKALYVAYQWAGEGLVTKKYPEEKVDGGVSGVIRRLLIGVSLSWFLLGILGFVVFAGIQMAGHYGDDVLITPAIFLEEAGVGEGLLIDSAHGPPFLTIAGVCIVYIFPGLAGFLIAWLRRSRN